MLGTYPIVHCAFVLSWPVLCVSALFMQEIALSHTRAVDPRIRVYDVNLSSSMSVSKEAACMMVYCLALIASSKGKGSTYLGQWG